MPPAINVIVAHGGSTLGGNFRGNFVLYVGRKQPAVFGAFVFWWRKIGDQSLASAALGAFRIASD